MEDLYLNVNISADEFIGELLENYDLEEIISFIKLIDKGMENEEFTIKLYYYFLERIDEIKSIK